MAHGSAELRRRRALHEKAAHLEVVKVNGSVITSVFNLYGGGVGDLDSADADAIGARLAAELGVGGVVVDARVAIAGERLAGIDAEEECDRVKTAQREAEANPECRKAESQLGDRIPREVKRNRQYHRTHAMFCSGLCR